MEVPPLEKLKIQFFILPFQLRYLVRNLKLCLHGAVGKALVLQSERRRFDPRPRRNIFAFSINVLFLKKIDLFEKTKNWIEIQKILKIRKKLNRKTQKKFGTIP